jgi:hypothetical protein
MNLQAALALRAAGVPRRANSAPLGEILVGRRALERARLAEALAQQPVSGRRLGDVLVARGWSSGGAVAAALAEQWGLRAADLTRDPPDGGLIDPDLTAAYITWRILPWRRMGDVVVYVTDRPEDTAAALAALGALGAPLAVVAPGDLDDALGWVLAAPLATRAAMRTPPPDSVCGLGWRRPGAVLAVLALVVGVTWGGTPGLVAGLTALFLLNAATTVLRLLALTAGLRRLSDAVGEPAEGGDVILLAAHQPLPVITLMVPLYREAEMVGEIAEVLRASGPLNLKDISVRVGKDSFLGRGDVVNALAALQGVGKIKTNRAPDGTPQLKKVDFITYEAVGETAPPKA